MIEKKRRGRRAFNQPILAYPNASETSTFVILRDVNVEIDPENMNLLEVTNPFGLGLERGIDLNSELRNNPNSPIFDELVEDVRSRIIAAQDRFDGILYRLHGADETHCSPMQYGGHYLEKDRELLNLAAEGYVVILVVAGKGAYLDFVSDLPGDVFAWDVEATGVSDAQVRGMRPGSLASTDPGSEISLVGAASLVEQLENQFVATV